MKFLRATQGKVEVLLFCLVGLGTVLAQPSLTRPLDAAATASAVIPIVINAGRAYPRVHLRGGIDLTYLGMFSPDAMFHAPSRFTQLNGDTPGEHIVPAKSMTGSADPSDVPEWMLLSSERIVENLEPPAHARAAISTHSRTAQARNHLMTAAYGRPSVILSPRYVVSDSQQRLILSDPSGPAVHVLDPEGKTSFRLVCGKGYRVHRPAGVATDAEDNIYVADSEHGMIVVFDSHGNFLRYVGDYHSEPDYASPQVIAVDANRGHLFVVDTPRNLVFDLDLAGNPLKRLGKNPLGQGTGDLDSPTDIALNHEHIFVLDRSGTRVQVLNMDFDPISKFDLPRTHDPTLTRDNGVAADAEGNVYVSYCRGAVVRVFSREGALVAAFGASGPRAGQFAGPAGLWISQRGRLYVADSGNGRVQMFQLKHVQ